MSKSSYVVLLQPDTTVQLLSNLGPNYFTPRATWLVKADQVEIFQDVYLPINSQFYSFTMVLDEVVVKESFKVAKGLKTCTKHIGSWKDKKLSWDNSPVFQRRKDFNGFQFEAVTLPHSTYNIVYSEDGELRVGGFYGEVWKVLENHFNFSTRMRMSPDLKWGARDENGEWNGMVKEVYENRSHIAISVFTLSKARSEVVDLSPSLFQDDIQMFIKYPERESSWTTFIEPFDLYLWLSLLGLLFLLSFTLSVTYHLGPEKKYNSESFTFSFNFFVALTAQMGQGSSIEPKSFSTRMVFISIFFLSVIVITSYSSKMVAFLALIKIQPEIANLEEVPGSNFKLGYVKGTAISDMFKKGEYGTIFKRIYDAKIKKTPTSIVDNISEGLEKIISEKYALVEERSIIMDLIKDNCDVLALPNPVSQAHTGYIWNKNLPHGQFFSHFINGMREGGVLDALRRKYTARQRSDCGTSDTFTSVGFVNIISAFAMLALAYLAGIMLCTAECLLYQILGGGRRLPSVLGNSGTKLAGRV